MSDDLSRVILILVVGSALGRLLGLAMIRIDIYREGHRAKMQAYAEMERRFPPRAPSPRDEP